MNAIDWNKAIVIKPLQSDSFFFFFFYSSLLVFLEISNSLVSYIWALKTVINVSLICNKNIAVSHCTGLVGLIVDEKDAELVPQQKMVRFIFNCDHCERMFPSHLSNILQATQKSNTWKYLPIHGLLDDVYLAFSTYFKPFNSSSFFEESYQEK